METQLLELFCDVDDFCKELESKRQKYLLPNPTHAIPKCDMSLSEIMTIDCYDKKGRKEWYCGLKGSESRW
jgi:hypothetical protein